VIKAYSYQGLPKYLARQGRYRHAGVESYWLLYPKRFKTLNLSVAKWRTRNEFGFLRACAASGLSPNFELARSALTRRSRWADGRIIKEKSAYRHKFAFANWPAKAAQPVGPNSRAHRRGRPRKRADPPVLSMSSSVISSGRGIDLRRAMDGRGLTPPYPSEVNANVPGDGRPRPGRHQCCGTALRRAVTPSSRRRAGT